MIDYRYLYQALRDTALDHWENGLADKIETVINKRGHGDFPKWLHALNKMPDISPSSVALDRSCVNIGCAADCSPGQQSQLQQSLYDLRPWRKGPFNVFGIHIDTEWRSDLKWKRVSPHITPLRDRVVLDVGCGSGYHCWRMQGEGAKLVIGIDPTLVYVMQYHALQRYIQSKKVFVLPFSTDNMPAAREGFDTVFSMGVMYHRRSPLDHLAQLWDCLRWEGELVLETLVVDGDDSRVLMPRHRYAKMRNVWFIPSSDALSLWLTRCNFDDIRCVNVDQTGTEEQRTTQWMPFESLADFLDPNDPGKTIEGYPAPKRAIFIARKSARSN